MKGLINRMVAVVSAIMLLTAPRAMAQEGGEFFSGKKVQYIIATEPGGGYDTYGRLIAEFMQKYLPGSTFVPVNMPGAGNQKATNYLYASKPDGLTIGTFNTGLIYRQIIGGDSVRFDLGEMSWIGKAASEPRVIVVSKQSGITSFEELRNAKEKLKFSSGSVGSAAAAESLMLVDAFKLPIQVISGYSGNDDQLAMMRGEVQGVVGSRSSLMPFVNEGRGRFIAQIGGSETDLPQLSSFAGEDDKLQQVVALVNSQSYLGRLTAGPPGIPEDRLQALREAYQSAVSDPEFKARLDKMGLPLDPAVGEPVADAVASALEQDEELVTFLRGALSGN